MNKVKLNEALKKSQFLSDPEVLADLLAEAWEITNAAWPNSSAADVLQMAKLMLYYEDGFDLEEPEE